MHCRARSPAKLVQQRPSDGRPLATRNQVPWLRARSTLRTAAAERAEFRRHGARPISLGDDVQMTDRRGSGKHPPTETGHADQSTGSGLFDGFDAYKTPTDEDYRRLLTEGIVVPDANVFLNLYRYNEQTRDDLFAVLRRLGDRLWVPHQVVAEFWRNREAVLLDPRATSITIKELATQRDKAIGIFRSWANRVSLGQQRADQLVAVLDQAFAAVISGVTELAENDATNFARDTSLDPVLQELEPIMRGRVGAALAKEERTQALKDAKQRAESKIPPGFKDSGKEPIAAAGDYLVWLQTIQWAKTQKRDVLFVTGDVKEDWWRREHGELRGPLPELVEEIREQAYVRFFILRPESLLRLARQVLKIAVHDESVQDVERIDQLSSALGYRSISDTGEIRARWGEVVEAVRRRSKVAWILLGNATLLEFDGDALTLSFERDGDAKGFRSSSSSNFLRAALDEVLGIDPRVLLLSPTGAIYEEKARDEAGRADRDVKATTAIGDYAVLLARGEKVQHDSYGVGVVVAVSGSPGDPEATVDFGAPHGQKCLLLRYAPIIKVSATGERPEESLGRF